MSGSVYASGTASGNAINTPYTLATITTSGTYVMVADIANMLAGDTVVLSGSIIVLAAGASHSVLYASFTGAPTGNGDQIWFSNPFYCCNQLIFSLNQTVGVARTYPWAIISY